MSTYAIGDVQGCFEPLLRLLDTLHFDDTKDMLWFAGDLVNRGPQSLETLRFIKSLGKKAITVLGNHDLSLLAVATNAIPYDPTRHTFIDILKAPDRDELCTWLATQPLLHHDNALEFTLVHAGIPPQWDLTTAQKLAKEVESVIPGADHLRFFQHIYDKHPCIWDPKLTGVERLRYIVNGFTRLRFCNDKGDLELTTTESEDKAPLGFNPWFKIPERKSQSLNILFGHWAALKGQTDIPNVFPLDTGCVWGNCLTAFRLEDRVKIMVKC